MNLARAVRTLHRPQWVPRPLETVFDFFEHPENLTLITPPWRGGREPAMSLDVRAAAVAAGAGGLRGWAAKAQCGLCHTPAGSLHWQAMPWDLTSNWSEEDRRAMLAYLRALPPVPGRVPGPRPPSLDDPVADTFGFGDRAIR